MKVEVNILEKKTQQHYVWEYYLKSWCYNESQFYCLRKNEKIFSVNPEKIAKEREFYKLKNITDKEAKLIDETFIKKQDSKILRSINREWIKYFRDIFEEQKRASEDVEWDRLIEANIVNLEEDYHNKLENNAKPYIDSLKNGDLNKIKNNEPEFLIFLTTQYFRTKKLKDNAIVFAREAGFEIEKIWNVLSHIFATSLTFGLITRREEYKWNILVNNTNMPFLTGDQPVINTHADYSSSSEIENELELYYPITPSKALLITDKNYGESSDIEIQKSEVEKYNSLIYDASYKQIFSNKKEGLSVFENL